MRDPERDRISALIDSDEETRAFQATVCEVTTQPEYSDDLITLSRDKALKWMKSKVQCDDVDNPRIGVLQEVLLGGGAVERGDVVAVRYWDWGNVIAIGCHESV